MLSIRGSDICHFNTQTTLSKPLGLDLFCEKQILVANEIMIKYGQKVFHLDATGSIVASGGEYARIFLYSIVVPVPITGEPALPVFEWLSDTHSAVFITTRIESWLRTVKSVLLQPEIIVTDCSWALINAATKAFNKVPIIEQINFQRRLMNGEQIKTTSLRLCCSHYIHSLARKLSKKNLSAKVTHIVDNYISLHCDSKSQIKKHILDCVGSLLAWQSISQLNDVFVHFVKSICSPTCNDSFRQSMKALMDSNLVNTRFLILILYFTNILL